MKTTLPERSLIIKERLDNIVKEILAVAKDKLAMIILFGSYARGTWVQDVYKEGPPYIILPKRFGYLACLKKEQIWRVYSFQNEACYRKEA